MSKNVFCFCPAFGQQISATTFLTVCALQQSFAQKGIGGGVSTLSFPDIAELRNMVFTIWYDTMPTATHLLFIDADMGFKPELVHDMLLFDEPLIGAVYPQRKLPLSWAGSGTGTQITERRGGFMEVEGVGMGCCLIRRDVGTRMLEYFGDSIVDTRLQLHPAGETIRSAGTTRMIRAFEKLDIPDRGLVSEDLSFCIRWRACGGKVWGAIGHEISHVGPFDFKGCYLAEIEKQAAATQGQLMDLPVTAGGTTMIEPLISAELSPQGEKFVEATQSAA